MKNEVVRIRARSGLESHAGWLRVHAQSELEIAMQVQIYSDHNIHGHQELLAQVSGTVDRTLKQFSDHLTRVDIHLSDQNSDKKDGHNAMRCMMEARIEGRRPIAVIHKAATLDQAVDGAAQKLVSSVERILGRLRDQKSHRTDPSLTEQKLAEPFWQEHGEYLTKAR